MKLQCLDLALRQHRVQRQGHVRTGNDIGHRSGQGHGQVLPTISGVAVQPDPSAFCQRFVRLSESRCRANAAVLQPRRLLVSGAVQGRQHILGQPRDFRQNGVRGFRSYLGIGIGFRHSPKIQNVFQKE